MKGHPPLLRLLPLFIASNPDQLLPQLIHETTVGLSVDAGLEPEFVEQCERIETAATCTEKPLRVNITHPETAYPAPLTLDANH